MPLSRPSRVDFFNDCVTTAMADIAALSPDALDGIIVGVEDVPQLNLTWWGVRVPLAAALEPRRGRTAQIYISPPPLAPRASSRGQLRRLVHRTIVEQLSTLTGRSIEELTGEDPDWDDD